MPSGEAFAVDQAVQRTDVHNVVVSDNIPGSQSPHVLSGASKPELIVQKPLCWISVVRGFSKAPGSCFTTEMGAVRHQRAVHSSVALECRMQMSNGGSQWRCIWEVGYSAAWRIRRRTPWDCMNSARSCERAKQAGSHYVLIPPRAGLRYPAKGQPAGLHAIFILKRDSSIWLSSEGQCSGKDASECRTPSIR
jgi:hypothetical protein